MLAARLVGPEGKVYAFEPFPESARYIAKNARLNRFEQIIEVWTCAISDTVGIGKLRVEGWRNTFKLVADDPGSRFIEVPIYSVDYLIRHHRMLPPYFVKIDVEGHEVQVLRGMEATIRAHRPIILCEVHWLVREIRELVEGFFKPLGYQAMQIDGQPLPERETRYHLLLIPPDRIAPEAHAGRRSG